MFHMKFQLIFIDFFIIFYFIIIYLFIYLLLLFFENTVLFAAFVIGLTCLDQITIFTQAFRQAGPNSIDPD